jgi:hypothetical protein
MLDHIALTRPATRAQGLVDGSARPDAPVVAARQRARLDTRARARLAARLHRVASALEPQQRREQAVATPACR